MMTLEVTYRDGRSERIEIPLERKLQDLRQYFNAETVEVLRVLPCPKPAPVALVEILHQEPGKIIV